PRDAAPLDRHPVNKLGWDPERSLVPRDMRARRSEVDVGRDRFVLQREHQLDQAGNSRGGFEMTQVGLDGSEPQGCLAVVAKDRTKCGDLQRVAELSTGPVRLDAADLFRRNACTL